MMRFALHTLLVLQLANAGGASKSKAKAKETKVGGGIYFDEVWTVENSPYVLSKNAKIGPNTTVTVEPGVVVEGDDHELAVVGTFVVQVRCHVLLSLSLANSFRCATCASVR